MFKKFGVLVLIFSFAFFSYAGTSPIQNPFADWILKQQVPNDIVPSPATGRAGLVLSYSVPSSFLTHAELYDRAYIYDNALAAISLTLIGKFEEAGKILQALATLTDAEGKLGIFYNTMSDGFEAVYRTGPIAWVGYAFCFYKGATQSDQFEEAAKRIAGWVLTMQDQTLGSVRGGQDATGFPTEDNIIAFFFLRDIGFQTRNRDYIQSSFRIMRSLLTNHWNKTYHCFQAGIGNEAKHLRAVSWGALFSLSIDQPQRAFRCLRFIEENFKTEAARERQDGSITITGYKPGLQDDMNFIWSEGSLSVALGHKRISKMDRVVDRKREKWVEIVMNIAKLRRPDGGILNAFPPVQNFPSWESLASTSWMVLVQARHQAAFWRGIPKRQQQPETRPNVTSSARTTSSETKPDKSTGKKR